MKTRFAYSTAGIALIISMMGTAHANESGIETANDPEVYGPTIISEDLASVALADIKAADDESDDRDALGSPYVIGSLVGSSDLSVAMDAPAGLPAAAASAAPTPFDIDTNVFDMALASAPAQDGVVRLRSVAPHYGDINPFYGDINPFYGDIGAFWGTINPFWGDINPFWGDINPFYGDINPFYGDIGAFWGDINPFYGDIVAFQNELTSIATFGQQLRTQITATEADWASLQYSVNANGSINMTFNGAPDRIRGEINLLIDQAEAQYGAAYTAATGRSFRDGFVADFLARHGVSLGSTTANKHTLALDANARARFYLDWNDSLMLYSGVDSVDHWMRAVNWTPAITQIQGAGTDSIVGVIDGSFGGDTDLSNNIVWAGGHNNPVGGHGAGVASLIAGAHDSYGVMGIAPNANIATYNPFNAAGETSWGHVADGILSLKTLNLSGIAGGTAPSVINMSLGERSWVFSPGMAGLFNRPDVASHFHDTVFVIAAGNEGATQTQNVQLNNASQAALIFVGATDPTGQIAGYSNRPGTACVTNGLLCSTGNGLMDRTIVAPGSLMLVSDGNGGVTRASGTSFAAPLVSGAITLLHDRWQWLSDHPHETAEIIFRSARDLGAPGVDPVYGWGMLDVAASQSPLDFNKMSFKLYKRGLFGWLGTSQSVWSLTTFGIPSSWETSDAFFTAFENIGDTHRDFSIPVSSFATGKSTNALGRGFERLQDFISARFTTWIQSGGTDKNGDGIPGFTEMRSDNAQLSGEWTLRYDAVAPQYTQQGELRMVHGAATLTNPSGKWSFTLGHGQGAMALSGNQFGVISDYDPYTGGANPVLGLASGEAFASIGYKLGENTKVSFGFSQNREEWDEIGEIDPLLLQQREALGDRPANAFTLDLEQKVTNGVTVGAQYTRLNEVNALLGTQTASAEVLGSGSTTDALTLKASINVGSGLSFDIAATGGRTETSQDQFFTSAGSVFSTAGQFTATKKGVFAGNDTLRVSVAQPLQVERGELQFVSDQIVNRETGEIGPVTQTIGIETERRITAEAVYALPLTRSSEFGVFSRYVSAGDVANEAAMVVGGNYSIRF